jgi:glycosyltransferase involved in cell wall biosynthesis
MKICLFTENYYKGGLDTFIINLINAWPDVKDDLTLVCNGSHPGLKTIAKKARRPVKIERYFRLFTSSFAKGQSDSMWSQTFPVRTFFVLVYRFLQYPLLFPWYVFTLMLYFRGSDFDRLMVINGGYPASLLGRSAVIAWWLAGRRPLATMNIHSLATYPSRQSIGLEKLIDKLVVRFSYRIIGVSKACISSLIYRSAFKECNKLSYVYNGIYDPVPTLSDDSVCCVRPIERYCLMLATYHAYKGHAYLLEAFADVLKEFADVHLRIFGHGFAQEKGKVFDEVVRLKLEANVTLGDFTTDTAAWLSGASVLVVPSQAYESFGLTIIEAMAFGVPVVTTNVGGMPEVLGDSNVGYVCSKDDPLEFAAAIKKILGNPILSSELGRNGRLAFESRFLASSMAQQYSEVLKSEEY